MNNIIKALYGIPIIAPAQSWKEWKRRLDKGSEKVLKILLPIGQAFTSVTGNLVNAGNGSGYAGFNYNKGLSEQHKLHAAEKVMVAVSPSNHVVAWTQGSLNPVVGLRKIAEWGPAALLGSFITDIAAFKYVPKAVRATPTAVDKALSVTGNKGAKGRVVAREINNTAKEGLRASPIERDRYYFDNGKLESFRDYEGTGSQMLESSFLDEKLNNGDPNTLVHFDRGDYKPNYWVYNLDGSKVKGAYVQEGKLVNPNKNGLYWYPGKPFQDIHWEHLPYFRFNVPTRYISVNRKSGKFNDKYIDYADGTRLLEVISEGPVDLSDALILQKNPLGWWERVKIQSPKSTKQHRVISEKTYPWYRGKQHSVKEVVNPDGTVNPRQAMRILHEVSELFPGSYRMEHRLENPDWHTADPTTYDHTKNVALSAWGLDVPYGFTKHDLMVAALGHDFGKIVAGNGHAQIGADLAKQVFPDLTDAQYKAIAEHMGTPITSLGRATKMADARNGIVVRNINGKTRILLPTHTDVKPREIVMEPKGNNKYYIHMRIWDDVGKLVPGNISNAEKSNLSQTLYETLPDGAEILFPQSGPGNYATRGAIAGLQHLSRDPRFTPGTKGTLQYLDKDGKTVKTYKGTSFIKKGEDLYSKEPVVRGKDYEDYVTRLGDEFLNHGAKVKLTEPDPELTKITDRVGFTPVFLMWPGARLRAHSKEIIRRLQEQGMDVDKETARLPMVGWGTVREVINKNALLPSLIGYFHKAGVTGLYNKRTGITLVDPTEYNKTVSTMLHERNMHGTQKILTPSMWNPYERFLHNIFGHGNVNVKEINSKKHYSVTDPENISLEHPITGGALKKEELRATLGLYRKNLYDDVAYPRAKADGVDIPNEDLEPLRPYFEAAVDELNLPQVKMDLSAINGYGRAYAKHGPKWHPNFLEELRELLKYSPGILPFMRNEKE